MNTILEDLDHICLRVGGSSFEMKYIGSFACAGNKMRVTTWEIGDRFVSLTQRFLQFVLVEEIEKTNMKTPWTPVCMHLEVPAVDLAVFSAQEVVGGYDLRHCAVTNARL